MIEIELNRDGVEDDEDSTRLASPRLAFRRLGDTGILSYSILVFAKSGSRYSLARQVAYRWRA